MVFRKGSKGRVSPNWDSSISWFPSTKSLVIKDITFVSGNSSEVIFFLKGFIIVFVSAFKTEKCLFLFFVLFLSSHFAKVQTNLKENSSLFYGTKSVPKKC
ncbi:hypothetical protein SDC9_146442 [bioreactor metagenome]|uniref:Uncharacterized protein n=1 Tax=bioreactor metagenome TaxID=1076179 RepID=A0A645ED19_9ZZZZ